MNDIISYMSEINERAIVIFLLNQMGFKSADERNYKRPYYQLTGGKIILFAVKSEPGFYFFPFSDIKHAWMVMKSLGNDEDAQDKFEGYFVYNQLDIIDITPRHICIAAVKALADDEQCKEWGL